MFVDKIAPVMNNKNNTLTLYHGSPNKLEIGDFVCPSFFDKYKEIKIFNKKTGKSEPVVFLTPYEKIAIRYACRDIYSVVDYSEDIQYMIFRNREQTFYIYETQLPISKLVDTISGDQIINIEHREYACFEPVQILNRYSFGIDAILDYYSKQNNIRTVARVLKNKNEIPACFGDLDGLLGKPCIASYQLKQDLNKYTTPRNVLNAKGKKELFDGISNHDKDYLKNCLEQDFQTIQNLTRNIYFMAVKYALSGFNKSVLSGTCLDAYNKYTARWVGDADKNFGTIKNPDCPGEFKQWYKYHAYKGGHPFEIYPYYCLYVNKNNKDEFYLRLGDMYMGHHLETINRLLKMYIALCKNGFFCEFPYKDYVLDIINERLR